LIQERLKSVMIPTIDQNHVHWLTGECFRGAQSGESTANDHDLFPQSILQSILSLHSPQLGSCGAVTCRNVSTRLSQMPHRCFVFISICLVSRDGNPYPRRTSSPTPYLKPQECGRPRPSHHSPKLGAYALYPSTALGCTMYRVLLEPLHIDLHFFYLERELRSSLALSRLSSSIKSDLDERHP
jgi:hypothetical protein